MNKITPEPKNAPSDAANLRKLAEEKAADMFPVHPAGLPPEEILQVLHELRVHQIELTMQNEELRRAQAEIEQAQARYFDLYNLAPVGYVTVSEKGLILEANLTAADLLGPDRRALIKQPLSRYILPDDQEIYYWRRKELFETGKPQVCDLRMVKPDGTRFWAHLSAAAARDIDSAPVCRLVITDITALKQAEMEKMALEAQNRQLHKAKSLGLMAEAIAHHFNNQLCAVMGYLEIATDNLPPGENLGEILSDAMKATREAGKVSSLMLTYLGQTPGERDPIDLSAICRKSMPLLQAAMPKGVLIKTDFPPLGPVVHANESQIQQILLNLVTNAREAISDNRGAMSLNVGMVSHLDISRSGRFPIDWQPRQVPYACIEVTDTGCGISGSNIEKIFDPFFTTRYTGRGLGLPVVLGTVKAHGGGITVASEPGQGSVFRVFLPVSTDERPAKQGIFARTDASQTGNGEKISKIESVGTVLLIEDEEAVRKMARITLSRLGYTVFEASNGVEALEIFREHRDTILLVLSDLTMPQMDGWETLAALRRLSPGIPVILSSGYDESRVMANDHTERPNAFLSKPYLRRELADMIRQVLENVGER